MTWDQIELFAIAASDRVNRDLLQNANLAALGTAVGFSGNRKPLDDIARALGQGAPSEPPSASLDELQGTVRDLAQAGQIRIKGHGTNRRRAGSRTRSPNKRVPIGTPTR